MAIRVTVTQVRNTIELSSAFTDDMVDQCIASANALTDGILSDKELSETLLFHIELYLSAHFCSVREPQLKNEEIGGRDATVKEERHMAQIGYGFNSTIFGQQAVTLDYTGTLGDISNPKKKTAGFFVMGPYEEED